MSTFWVNLVILLFLSSGGIKLEPKRSDESPKGTQRIPKGTQRIHKGTQRMLKEPQNNVISYSKWKILTKTCIFNIIQLKCWVM